MRNIFVNIWLVMITVFFVPLLIFCKLTHNFKVFTWYVKIYSRSTCWVAGADTKLYHVEKLKMEEPYLLVANHESFFDLWTIYGNVDKRIIFVAKKELAKIPIIGGWMKMNNTIFLDRENPRQAIKDMKIAASLLEEYPVGIMPSGTRSREELEFKAGSFKIAKKAKKAIIPVTLVNTSGVYEDRTTNIKQPVIMYVHDPIKYDDYKDKDLNLLAKEISQLVYEKRNELAKEYNVTY